MSSALNFASLGKAISEASKSLTIEQEFLKMYQEAVVRLDEHYRPSQSYKPSSLGGCLRCCFFMIIGAEQDVVTSVDPSLCEICDSGTDRHLRIQTTISKMESLGLPVKWLDVGEFLEKFPVSGTRVKRRDGMETLVRNDILNLNFKCDGLIEIKGVVYILEIKTETSFQFTKRTGPEDAHRTQAACYSACLGINKTLFFYENRDVCIKKPYFVEITQSEINERVVNKIETVEAHVQAAKGMRSDVAPVPPKCDTPKLCKYCNYKKECSRW